MNFPRIPLLLVPIILSIRLVASQCFFPDGREAPGFIPCDEDAEVSSCCGDGAYCLSNGLCLGAGSFFRREACTDPEWGDQCAQYCVNAVRSGSVRLWICQPPDASENGETVFTCGDDASTCATSNDSMPVGDWRLKLLQGQINISQSSNGVVPGLRPQLVGNSIPSSLANNTSSIETETAASSRNSCSPAAMAGVGGGVALPLSLVLIGTLVLLRREKRQNIRLTAEINNIGQTQEKLSPDALKSRGKGLHELHEIFPRAELPSYEKKY